MFWQIDEETIPSSPADLFELQEQVRCEDEWLMAVLDANRQGAETWEMYCFTHGLPTLHVGSWLPAENMLRCGQTFCEELQSTHWPEMFRRKATWEQRSSLECNTCQQERRRRCRVLTTKTLDQGTTLTDTNQADEVSNILSNSASGQEDATATGQANGDVAVTSTASGQKDGSSVTQDLLNDFAGAPYIHPFNQPKYHAQICHALHFAKVNHCKLYWSVAQDCTLTALSLIHI